MVHNTITLILLDPTPGTAASEDISQKSIISNCYSNVNSKNVSEQSGIEN